MSTRKLPPAIRPAVLIVAGLLIGIVSGYAVWGGAFTASVQRTPGQPSIVIAIQPTASAQTIAPRAEELEQFLESRVDANIEVLIPTTYAAVIEAVRFGHAEVAFMSAWPSYLANKHAGAELVLAEVREVTIDNQRVEETFYFSHYVVLKDSPFQNLEDLRGLRVVYPSQLSTSGYLYAVDRLIQIGLIPKPEAGQEADPGKFFGQVQFAGGYAQGWELLKAGQADVMVIAGDVSASLFAEVMANTRILETQGPIPSHGIVFSKEFQGPLRDQLVNAFLELGNPEHRDLMRKMVSGIFVRFEVTTTQEHLAALAAALDNTGFRWVDRIG